MSVWRRSCSGWTRTWADTVSRQNDERAISALIEELTRQIDAMKALRTCLDEEHRALQLRDPEQLIVAIERKNDCIGEAKRIEEACRELDPADSIRHRAIRKKRDQLDTLARTCRDLNEANGSLIRRQRTRVQATLQILRGNPEQSSVYGPSGETDNAGATRTLRGSV